MRRNTGALAVYIEIVMGVSVLFPAWAGGVLYWDMGAVFGGAIC